MDIFEAIMQLVMQNEGGYVLHEVEHDTGGRTFAGIAENHWPDWEGWDYIDAGKDTSQTNPEMVALVNSFYKKNFWDPLNMDGIDSMETAYSIFDFAVNAGLRTSARLAQRAAGVKVIDGKIGPVSLKAINECDPTEFELRFAVYKLVQYMTIIGNNHTQAKFSKGWANRALRVLQEID